MHPSSRRVDALRNYVVVSELLSQLPGLIVTRAWIPVLRPVLRSFGVDRIARSRRHDHIRGRRIAERSWHSRLWLWRRWGCRRWSAVNAAERSQYVRGGQITIALDLSTDDRLLRRDQRRLDANDLNHDADLLSPYRGPVVNRTDCKERHSLGGCQIEMLSSYPSGNSQNKKPRRSGGVFCLFIFYFMLNVKTT